MKLKVINPKSLAKAIGYNHGIKVSGKTLLFLAGQVGWDKNFKIVSENFVRQFEQALKNLVAVLKEAGGKSKDIVKMNIYVTSKKEYLSSLKPLGKVYKKIIGRYYPAMTLVEVKGLVEKNAKVEIEGIAVLK